MSANTALQNRAEARARTPLQTRYRLLLLGGSVIVLTLMVIAQAVNAYGTSYRLFEDIAVVNSTKVDAAEQALQYIANASQATADYAALTSDTPLFESAQNNIFRNFHNFRDQMFILRSNLESQEENTAFTVADTYTYSRFWRHVSNLLSQRSNLDSARREYLSADNHLRNRIIPALQELEALNFEKMVDAGHRAGEVINTQIILLAVPALALALLVTYVSFWLRGKVRRYLTPGIDAALILVWVIFLAMLLELIQLPGQLRQMTLQSYSHISGSSRVLVLANQANRAESSAVIDAGRADYWYPLYDENMTGIELRICGQSDCMNNLTFTVGGETNQNAASAAANVSPAVFTAIEGITPLMGDVTSDAEAVALENARLAYLEYRSINLQLRDLIASGDLDKATLLNTKADAGTSEEAFSRFVLAMEQARTLNRTVFDQIWNAQRAALPRNQILYGTAGYGLVILLVLAGVYHRYREL